ncbi:MAG: hypothetical protein NC489_34050 [Ruminococcus flavefaciens]|nr:hypothetical protein [Ruminococcus flavefaciens]
MTLAELLKDNYKEGMTLEDVTKALEGIEFPKADPAPAPGGEGQNPMQSYETEKLKAAVSKANAEAAKLKRELQARMSEEERREAERKAKEDEVNEKLAELQRAKIVSDTKAQYLALGYEASLADRAAEAAADNDHGTLFLVQKQHQDALVKKIRAEILKSTPKPSGGTQAVPKDLTKEQFANLSYMERLNLFNENPDLYKELNGE